MVAPLRRLLIANRGEIACRVMRTAQRMGVQCVAVFSDPDRHAQHVKMADEARCLGGTTSAESYLRGDAVIAAAIATGADSIHPGYGFLSENAAFADAVKAAGLTFVGPPAQAMRDMGAKDAAKRLMEEANVPLLPGYHGEDQSWETMEREADRIGLGEGLPVLLKAVLGGGGKGMRIVWTKAELKEALESAKREAMASFNDDRMLIERYLPSARHIEVQVMCDTLGGAVHLFERDCSVQRRHQKVLEEAPGPGIDDVLRKELGEAAVRAARAVNYVGAGTVEFIADAADPSRFYFMEMNTRLQVEHPVTEAISGVDLVEWQLLVAGGGHLPLKQEELTLGGHAFEARVYAERPEAGFLPGSGTLHHLRTPADEGDTYQGVELRSSAAGSVVRTDIGVVEGDEISVFYDPMIAKVIVRGPDRPAALQLLKSALQKWEAVGVPTNVPFLRRCLETDGFMAGGVATSFIDENEASLLPKTPPPPTTDLLSLAAMHWLVAQTEALHASLPPASPWATAPFGRLGGSVCGGAGASPLLVQPLDFDGEAFGEPADLSLRRTSADGAGPLASYEMSVGEAGLQAVTLLDWCASTRAFRALVGEGETAESVSGTAFVAPAEEGMATHVDLFINGERTMVAISNVAQQAQMTLSAAAAGAGAASLTVNSPMPGKIVRVLVAPGQAVAAGEALVVLEAMKMEHVMKAPADSVIADIHCADGDVVGQRAQLISFADPAAAAA